MGLATWDLLYLLEGPPSFETSTRTLDSQREGGGPVATGLAAASKLGARAAYLGKVGDDYFGERIIDNFEEYGVVTDHARRPKGSTSEVVIALVEEETGRRTFISDRNSPEMLPEEVPMEEIEKSEFLLIDQYHPKAALAAADRAQEAGKKVVTDLESVREESRSIISSTDFLIVPEKFAKSYTGEKNVESSARMLLEGGPKLAIVTRGERGYVGAYEDGTFQGDSFPVGVVDTTGAGDVFHGAFVVGLMQGWDYGRIAEFASAVSALNCTQLGGRNGVPTYEETVRFLSR